MPIYKLEYRKIISARPLQCGARVGESRIEHESKTFTAKNGFDAVLTVMNMVSEWYQAQAENGHRRLAERLVEIDSSGKEIRQIHRYIN